MFRSIIAFALLIFLIGCDEQPESNIPVETDDTTTPSVEYDNSIVITVGDRTVTSSRLAPFLERFQGDSLLVNVRVESLISRMLILQDAYGRGFDSTREMEFFFDEREREKLQNSWLAWILDEKVKLPPDAVEEYYSQLGTMLIYSAITVQDSSSCDSLRRLVVNGENMGDLAEEYSTIPSERGNRGVLGPVEMMEVSPGDNIYIQGLELGELSSVESSGPGWRFLRIDSIYQDTVPPFDEVKDAISERLLRRLRIAYRDELYDSLKTINDFQITEGIPELIANHFSENNQIFEPFTSEQENLVAYTFTGGERTLYSLVENILSIPPIASREADNPEWIIDYSQLLGIYDIMAMEARKLSMDTLPDIVSYMDRRFSNQVLDIYYEEVIEPRLVPTEEKLREIYETRQDTLIIPEARVFKTICAVEQEQLDLLERVMESGGDPFAMTEELTTVQSILAPGETTITIPLTVSDVPPLWYEILFNTEMHETVTCSIAAERVMVFELMEIRPEHIASFNESQNRLQDIFRSLKEEEIISGLVDSLSSVYHIDVDRDFIDRFIYTDSSSVYQQ